MGSSHPSRATNHLGRVFRTRLAGCVAATVVAAAQWACKEDGQGRPPSPVQPTSPSASARPQTTQPPTSSAPQTSPPSDASSTAAACAAKPTRTDRKRDLSRRETRIVGGETAKEGDFGFTVALASGTREKPRQYCGGSLIGDRWVLTAAHCQVLTGELVITGRRDLSTSAGRVIPVKDVLNHADYDPDTNDNDVALVELDDSAGLPGVALHEAANELVGDSVVVGWGYLKEGGPASSKLQEVLVPLVTNSVCQAGYQPDHVTITSNMLCAGLAQGGKDSCQGDSGGPLLIKGAGGQWEQAGIVSFGIGCARPNRYGVYTRVKNYVPWIRACMAR
ncbi:MAG: serine protease [Polyangiaceae bacterium]|nr:serine protease [Polyangiaceae bacterium]